MDPVWLEPLRLDLSDVLTRSHERRLIGLVEIHG
jgi:hypothetical protein